MSKAIEKQSEGLVSVQRDHSRLVQRTKKQLSEFSILFNSILTEIKQATERTVLSYESQLTKLSAELSNQSDLKSRLGVSPFFEGKFNFEDLEEQNAKLRAKQNNLLDKLSARDSVIFALEKTQRELTETLEKNDLNSCEQQRSIDLKLKQMEVKKQEFELMNVDLNNSLYSKKREV